MKKLSDCEFCILNIVWENEPLSSRELTARVAGVLGWKRTTTYTVLKKLCDGGYLSNRDAVVTATVPRKEVLAEEYRVRIAPAFSHSLPDLLSAALRGVTLTDREARSLKRLIDAHREKAE